MHRSFSPAPPDAHAAEQTRALLDSLAKPPGSLGRLEVLAVRLAAAQGRCPPSAEAPRVIVFAADHGVARAERVTPYPPEVTAAMVRTFAAGRAAVTVLARAAGASLEVVDVGVVGLGPVRAGEGVAVVRAAVAEGTANLAVKPAMRPEVVEAAIGVGADAVDRAFEAGCDVLALGEMGIGNSSSAAALAARLLGLPASALVGPGTGLDAAGVARKVEVVQRALDRGGPSAPRAALADLGGLEIAALVGAMSRASELRLPVLLDGFIASAAALVAVLEEPGLRSYLLPTTRSAEPGHGVVLDALALGAPMLDWGLRLGEASASALTLPLVRAATRLPREMATLAEVLALT